MSSMPWLERFFANAWIFGLWRRGVVRSILRSVPSINCSVLEIGCGDGTTTGELALGLPNAIIEGIECDPAQIRLAKKRTAKFGQRVKIQLGDAARLDFKSEKFSMVFSFLTLHHVENWQQALKETFRVLKSGGLLVVEDLALDRWTWLRHGFMPRPPSCFSKQQFVDAVAKAGFVITKTSGAWHFVVFARKPGCEKKLS